MPDNIVHKVFLVNIAVSMAAMPANNLMFSREMKSLPEFMKSSGAIKADSTAGGTYCKSLFVHVGMSHIPKRNMKDALVR